MIPAGQSFAVSLAQGLLDQTSIHHAALTQYHILLPTRRACRTLRETFLSLTNGQPLLLPRMQPIGDVEEDELTIEMAGLGSPSHLLELPPSLSSLRRRVLLARTIMHLPDYGAAPDHAFALADALGRLMDQIYTEGLDLRHLPALVEDETLAKHWQITVDFLEILSRMWPQILAEQGVIDAADHRNRLILALADHWEEIPPSHPVLAAGSTGSIPATGRLLKVIAGLPQGSVILPGLDQTLDVQSWQALDDTHPQATLKQLLNYMDVDYKDVQLWPSRAPLTKQADEPTALTINKNKAQNWLASEMMRPAATADQWQNLTLEDDQRTFLTQSLAQIMRFECDTAQEEARLIALLMRETLESKEKTAALITPDRVLARRVAIICQRWGIEIDDSGGQKLGNTALGSFLRLIMQAALSQLRPGDLAALLKHKLCCLGKNKGILMALTDQMERDVLRGMIPGKGFSGLYEKAREKKADTGLIEALEVIFGAFSETCTRTDHFSVFLDAHIGLAEKLAQKSDGSHNLWQGEEGEAAALFLADLREQGALLPQVNGESYLAILEQLMQTISVRPTYGTHPRLFIFGQLEARLVQADLVILGGLNEGTWPPDAGNDPWMSRPMRQKFGLPSPERAIGLAAHDFVQGFCASHTVLTRARRVDGTPTVAARWLQRLDTVLQALAIEKKTFSSGVYQQWAQSLDMPDGGSVPVSRPQPRPPLSKRPNALYVTAIERWMRDPYHIYARYILRLRKLKPLEEQTDASERGTMMHEILDKFITLYPVSLPENASEILVTLGRTELAAKLDEPRLWGFWWPRFERLAQWFVNHERQWRQNATPYKTEVTGTVTLDIDGQAFTLSARVDRLDKMEGGYAVIDYKTGSTPTVKDIQNGFSPQLPLEAVLLREGGFEDIQGDDVLYTGFWSINGGTDSGKEIQVKTDIEQARTGLLGLVHTFRDPLMPYYSLPRPDKAPPVVWQDYAHLARVQEWVALEDEEAA